MTFSSPATLEPQKQPQSTPGLGSRRTRLREATAACHQAVESAVERRRYFANPTAYSAYISRLFAIYSVLEPALERGSGSRVVSDWPRRRKLPSLAEDLAALSRQSPIRAPHTFDGIGRAFADVQCCGSALGMLYVIEGSTLGGALLARRAAQLGFTSENGARFLNIYGASRPRMWRSFLAALEEAPLDPVEEAALTPAAQRVFSLFHWYLG